MDDQSLEVSQPISGGVSEAESPQLRQTTRRKFLKWGTVLVVGASAGIGKLVAFTPTAAAITDISCSPLNYFAIDFGCIGQCQPFQSCCRYTYAGAYCCCTCYAGPYNCQPATFRARAYKTVSNSRCCCATCV
jgi:hypothetical protein